MPNAQNTETLAKIKEDLGDITAVWVVDYRGLTVKEVQQLRRNIREAGSIMKVYKNNLVRLALADLQLPNMDEVLAGPSAFVFSTDDPVASAKVLKDFSKDNENLEIKGGLMDGAFVTADEVKAIAALPSREQLYAQLAGLLSGFARDLACAVNAIPSGVARATAAVAEQKNAA